MRHNPIPMIALFCLVGCREAPVKQDSVQPPVADMVRIPGGAYTWRR